MMGWLMFGLERLEGFWILQAMDGEIIPLSPARRFLNLGRWDQLFGGREALEPYNPRAACGGRNQPV